jgi:hypothetical protein
MWKECARVCAGVSVITEYVRMRLSYEYESLLGPMPCFSMTMRAYWSYALLQYDYEAYEYRAYLALCLASV